MTTCFIFTEHFDNEQCLCLCLDQQGQVEAPLALRPISELRAMQMNARTIVVLPTDTSSLYELELPWLGERKARTAIPYALEEQLAQNVATLHFAFDRQHYQNNRYLVVVSDKQMLIDLIAKLDGLDIDFDLLTLDWFALKENEICVTETGLLVHDHLFKGALSGEMIPLYLDNKERAAQLQLFKDSQDVPQSENIKPIDCISSLWVAQRLLESKPINLCQGELQHDTSKQSSRQWYRIAAILAGVLVVSTVLFKMLYLHSLNTKIADLDKKIAVIYHEFFPEAQQVISPKFRIEQLLKAGNGNASPLWILLDKLAGAFKGSQITIEQFRFQNQVLSVSLVSKDFAALEHLQQRLQQSNVKVTQAQASSHDHQVMATLELSL